MGMAGGRAADILEQLLRRNVLPIARKSHRFPNEGLAPKSLCSGDGVEMTAQDI
jgi:hypothetical protein